MRAGFSPAARASDVYFEAMNVASPHSAITSAHCLVGVGYTDTINRVAELTPTAWQAAHKKVV
jgi:hypothetical protein